MDNAWRESNATLERIASIFVSQRAIIEAIDLRFARHVLTNTYHNFGRTKPEAHEHPCSLEVT